MTQEIHGQTDVQVEGRLVHVIAKGAFNIEGTQAAYRAIESAAKPLIGAPWIKLTDFRECMLGDPECLRLIANHNSWCAAHSCVAMALLYNNMLVKEVYRKQTLPSGLNLRAFVDELDARLWLMQQLDHATCKAPDAESSPTSGAH